MSEVAQYTVRDGVAVITMNNPPVNGLGNALRAGLMEALKKAEGELALARKAAEDARLAAETAKQEREKAADGTAAKKATGTRGTGNCFTFNSRTFCQ